MGYYLSTKEFWLTTVAICTALTLLWKGLKVLVGEVRAILHRVAYIQACLQKYGPTLIEIAEAYRGDTGKTLIDSVKRIETMSASIERITTTTKKASDRSIDVLQACVLALQSDMHDLTKALAPKQPNGET